MGDAVEQTHRVIRSWWRVAWVCALLGASPVTASGQAGSPTNPVLTDPGETKLGLTPTARVLPPGKVSITVIGPLPMVQVGVTDRLSAGLGFFPFALDNGLAPVLLVPKWQVTRIRQTQVAVGALHLVGSGGASIGLAYVVATRGNSDAAVTAGVGWLYARSQDDGGAAPAGIVGVEHRIGGGVKFIADSYLFDGGALGSLGVRLIRGRLATDVVMVVLPFDNDLAAVPTITFVWRF